MGANAISGHRKTRAPIEAMAEMSAKHYPTVRRMGTRFGDPQDEIWPPPGQATKQELRDTPTPANTCERRERNALKIRVKSARGKRLQIDMEPVDAAQLMSAFRTVEPRFANLMLSSIINIARDGAD
jgi:hypothetical protein